MNDLIAKLTQVCNKTKYLFILFGVELSKILY